MLAYRGRILGHLGIPAFGSGYLSGLPSERGWSAAVSLHIV